MYEEDMTLCEGKLESIREVGEKTKWCVRKLYDIEEKSCEL